MEAYFEIRRAIQRSGKRRGLGNWKIGFPETLHMAFIRLKNIICTVSGDFENDHFSVSKAPSLPKTLMWQGFPVHACSHHQHHHSTPHRHLWIRGTT